MTNSYPSIRSTSRHRYRGWDGESGEYRLSAEEMLDILSDDLLSRDPDRVMNQALHQGAGSDQAGLDQVREQLRQQSAELEKQLSSADLSDIANALAKQAEQSGHSLAPETEQLLESMVANPGKLVQTLSNADPGVRLDLESELQSLQASQGVHGSHDNIDHQQHLSELAAVFDHVRLEENLSRTRSVADVEDIDDELVRRLLGKTTASNLYRLTSGLQSLIESGYIQHGRHGSNLSTRAVQHIGNEMLQQVFRQLASRTGGEHDDVRSIAGLDRSGTSRAYEFGDPFDLNLGETILNAVKRGEGSPVHLHPADMSIFEREETSRVATVLAIDTSRSMGDRGYLLAAKKLALTLSMLIRNRFPRDLLHIVGFSEEARTIQLADLPELRWDRFGLGTNVQDALLSSRQLLHRHRNLHKNLILITDGEPTAYSDPEGELQFCQPPTAEALAATYAEAKACVKDRVSVLVVLLSAERKTVKFASELSRRAKGDLIVTDPDALSAQTVLTYGRIRSQQ